MRTGFRIITRPLFVSSTKKGSVLWVLAPFPVLYYDVVSGQRDVDEAHGWGWMENRPAISLVYPLPRPTDACQEACGTDEACVVVCPTFTSSFFLFTLSGALTNGIKPSSERVFLGSFPSDHLFAFNGSHNTHNLRISIWTAYSWNDQKHHFPLLPKVH